MNAYTLRPPRPGARRAKSRRRRGLSLFGVLMALGIAAAAVVGVVAIYNTTTETQNRNEAQALMTSLVIAVRQIHQGAADYGTADLVPLLALRNAIPSSARRGNTIVHPFGDNVTVNGSATSGAANGRFTITFANLEPANCAMLLDPYIGQTSAGGLLWGVQGSAESAVSQLTTALNPTTIGARCGTTTGPVVLEFE